MGRDLDFLTLDGIASGLLSQPSGRGRCSSSALEKVRILHPAVVNVKYINMLAFSPSVLLAVYTLTFLIL